MMTAISQSHSTLSTGFPFKLNWKQDFQSANFGRKESILKCTMNNLSYGKWNHLFGSFLKHYEKINVSNCRPCLYICKNIKFYFWNTFLSSYAFFISPNFLLVKVTCLKLTEGSRLHPLQIYLKKYLNLSVGGAIDKSIICQISLYFVKNFVSAFERYCPARWDGSGWNWCQSIGCLRRRFWDV